MRAVVQRVSSAKVTVEGVALGTIGRGLLVFLAVGNGDTPADAAYLAEKVAGLRIFENEDGKMSLSLGEINGELLVISQFTLYGDLRRGKRPSFDAAAPPEIANELYENFITCLRSRNLPCQTGKFRATMQVELVNDGPVTILLDSSKTF